MKVKTEKLDGFSLYWAVAVAIGYTNFDPEDEYMFSPSPGDGWRVLSEIANMTSLDGEFVLKLQLENRISVQIKHDGWWLGCQYDLNDEPKHVYVAQTPREAILRVFVDLKLGSEVDVPDSLIGGNHED